MPRPEICVGRSSGRVSETSKPIYCSMVALHPMFGPGANREPVFLSYRGATTSQTKQDGRAESHRDYPMFNHRLMLEPIGNIPPAEAEAQYYAAITALDVAV